MATQSVSKPNVLIVAPWSQENVHQSADKELTLEMLALEILGT